MAESTKKITIGDGEWPITGDEPPVVFADLVTEIRLNNGVVSLSLANGIIEGNGPLEARRAVCLRIPLGTVQLIGSILNQMVADSLKKPEPSQVN